MGAAAAAAGVLVVGLVVVDAFWTALWSGMGGGPLTTLITASVRTVMGSVPMSGRRRLALVGPVVLLTIVVVWAVLLLVGFSLVAQAMPNGIVSSETGLAADGWERVYYVGYTLFTLGMGDFVPAGDGARMLTVAMNALGMFMVTLGVTYLLPVISASVGARSFGSSVLSLGETPAEVIVEAWDGERVRLDDELRGLASDLSTLAHQHLAYPVLHLFHSADLSASAPRAVAVADGTLGLLEAVDATAAPAAPARRQLRSAIDRYVDTFGAQVGNAPEPPPSPQLDALERAGIPLVCDQAHLDLLLQTDEDRRRRLHGVLDAAGVAPPTSASP